MRLKQVNGSFHIQINESHGYKVPVKQFYILQLGDEETNRKIENHLLVHHQRHLQPPLLVFIQSSYNNNNSGFLYSAHVSQIWPSWRFIFSRKHYTARQKIIMKLYSRLTVAPCERRRIRKGLLVIFLGCL